MLLFVVGHLLHFRVVGFRNHLVRASEVFFNLFELAVLFDDLFEVGMLLGDLLKLGGIGDQFGGLQLLRQIVVARAELIESFG